jgi:inward rectifier potassium channel
MRSRPKAIRIRRIHDLTLVRNRHPVFLFGWTMLHVIDDASPLAGETSESLSAAPRLLLLTVSGTMRPPGRA